MIGHILAKYLNINIVTRIFVFSFKARPCFAFQKVEKAMSDSSGYCNLCCRVIEERNERLKVWKYLCDRPKTSTFAETVLQN